MSGGEKRSFIHRRKMGKRDRPLGFLKNWEGEERREEKRGEI